VLRAESQADRRFAAPVGAARRICIESAPVPEPQENMLDLLSFAVLPGLLVAAGALLARYGGAIFAQLAPLAPYLATVLAAAVAWRFRQTKLVLSCAALLLGYSLLVLPGALGGDGYRAAALYVPATLGWLALARERGLLNQSGLIRLGVLTAPAILITALVAGHNGLPSLPLLSLTPHLGASPVPVLAALATGAALAGMSVQLVRRRTPIEAGQAGALVAAMLAVDLAANRTALATLMATAAVILAVAVIQNGYRVAFHDELTGLPGRRALRALEATLGDHYVVAMLDVDHFKKFNDTYGHDIGDQVLCRVASIVGKVGGGGHPFRYGGEEFTAVFPGRSLEEALPHLEAVCHAMATTPFEIRGPDRPVAKPDETKPPAKSGNRKAKPPAPAAHAAVAPGERKLVTITISIGAAARTPETPTPETVMKAADLALYRAKEKGRNQVST
jgi:GGDEF domain-containing protein